MASGGNTLSKAERLSGKKSIATLLADGKWGAYGHFRYCWLEAAASQEGYCPSSQKNAHQGSTPPALPESAYRPGRILISVPKRFFKRAVKRNLLKRRIREAYRVRKVAGVDILFQYNSPELADFATISADVAAILARVCECLTDACRADEHFSAKKACNRPAGTTEL